MIQIIGVVNEIFETKSYPKKDEDGTIYITRLKIDNKYFSSFKKEEVEALSLGMTVDVCYTEKENIVDGKTYVNNNITSIKPHDVNQSTLPAEAVKPSSIPQQTPTVINSVSHRESGIAFIELYGVKYKITLEGCN